MDNQVEAQTATEKPADDADKPKTRKSRQRGEKGDNRHDDHDLKGGESILVTLGGLLHLSILRSLASGSHFIAT